LHFAYTSKHWQRNSRWHKNGLLLALWDAFRAKQGKKGQQLIAPGIILSDEMLEMSCYADGTKNGL